MERIVGPAKVYVEHPFALARFISRLELYSLKLLKAAAVIFVLKRDFMKTCPPQLPTLP